MAPRSRKVHGPPKRRLRYGVAVILDGFIAGPKGDYDWIVMDPAIDFAAMYKEFDTAVMGRKAYEVITKMGGGHGAVTGMERYRGPVVFGPGRRGPGAPHQVHQAARGIAQEARASERRRERRAECFTLDYPEGKPQGRYVEAELPTLPFADRSFDLAPLLASAVPIRDPEGRDHMMRVRETV